MVGKRTTTIAGASAPSAGDREAINPARRHCPVLDRQRVDVGRSPLLPVRVADEIAMSTRRDRVVHRRKIAMRGRILEGDDGEIGVGHVCELNAGQLKLFARCAPVCAVSTAKELFG